MVGDTGIKPVTPRVWGFGSARFEQINSR